MAAPPATVSPAVESIDPATGDVIARFEVTLPGELPRVLERARRAQAEWAARPLPERCALLRRLRETIFARRRELAEVVTREVGKPRVEALLSDVCVALDAAEYYARQGAAMLRPERVPHHHPAFKLKSGWLLREPCGVVGLITPWNYPLAIPLTQVMPAVVAGNAVVLKPSELAPWCGAVIGELFAHAGFPRDLVQVVHGRGEAGAALIEAAPDKIVFTGSAATGRRVAEGCARRLIPSVLELGGKDAMIVLADAGLEIASSAAVWGSFTNCGQACISVERIYAERGIAERFVELCTEKTRRLKLGPGSDPQTDVGPMIRPEQVERVEQQLRAAIAQGARILTGGRRRPDLGPCFFEPTVVTGVSHAMGLMQEETFGPVLAVQSVANAEEAIALANDSPFGLAASIWTRDRRHGRALASRVRAGAVMVNDLMSYYGITEAPHGGRGKSGWGRTHSRLGLLEMVQVKYVDVDRLPAWFKPWWYGYSQELGEATERFVEFLFAPDWQRRLASARGALRTLFRGRRI